jgi:RHS repeat-associated protein
LNFRRYYQYYETGFYSLQSRYYDPEIGRFINADTTDVLDGGNDHILENNLFAYCFNNPVNLSDETGEWPSWATKVLIGTAVIAAAAVLTVATAGTGTALACFAVGALKGAAIGAATGAASGAAFGAVGHRISTGSWKGAGKAALNGAADGYMTGAITGFISGGLTSNVCFVAGTSVLTASGNVAIETIKSGDLVWSENPETGEKALKRVVQTFINETNELVHVYVDGEEIVTTPEHPFYVPQQGWTGAIHLRAGDSLVLSNGKYVIVERIQHEILESPITVYNFEVEDFHTYYVGENSILVHNLCNGKWTSAGKGASSNANYHFNKHGYEVGARTLQEYTTKATNFANQVLQKGIKGKYVSGATANTYRYVFNGKYVDMAWNGVEHILVSFGKVVR